MNLKKELLNEINYKTFREILTIAQLESKYTLLKCSINLRQSKSYSIKYAKYSSYKDVLIDVTYKDGKPITTNHIYIDEIIFAKSLSAPEKFIVLLLNIVKRIKIDTLVNKYKLSKRLLVKTLKISKMFCLNNDILTIDKEEIQKLYNNPDKQIENIEDISVSIKSNRIKSLIEYTNNSIEDKQLEYYKNKVKELEYELKQFKMPKVNNINQDIDNFDQFSWEEIDNLNNISLGIN